MRPEPRSGICELRFRWNRLSCWQPSLCQVGFWDAAPVLIFPEKLHFSSAPAWILYWFLWKQKTDITSIVTVGQNSSGPVLVLTLQPSDLRGRPVALLVAGGDAEDDGGLGGVVDVRVGQGGGLNQAARVGTTVHPHEGQLGRARTGRLGLTGLDGQVHRVLCDASRGDGGRLPGELGPAQVLEGQQSSGQDAPR